MVGIVEGGVGTEMPNIGWVGAGGRSDISKFRIFPQYVTVTRLSGLKGKTFTLTRWPMAEIVASQWRVANN